VGRILIAGGGTGGHVFPALALADQLKATAPEVELLFVGSVGGMEERLVPAHGYELEVLRVDKLRGGSAAARLAALARLPLALAAAWRLLRRFSPQVVVGLGGYASAPVVLAALARKVPTVLLEQNAVPGTVNRLLARLGRRRPGRHAGPPFPRAPRPTGPLVVTSFRRAARHLPIERTLLLGNPVRRSLLDVLAASPEKGGAADERPGLLVLGGSQGARAVNELVCAAAPRVLERVPGLRIVHQTGTADLEWVRQRYSDAGLQERVTAEAFIEEMGPAYRQASLVLGRSGATTLAELCVAGLPALLVPYPFAADDHQAENAAELVEAGGALMVRQSELDAARLEHVLCELLLDAPRLKEMGRAMRRCGRPDAAAAIADLLLTRYVQRGGP
jgi:UDP-N-acetylglucosamine--N-acetylmuramyl-(pentapeptide) pyrophosphoryl-undecaprenol N-acetylglucosamine transferase